jgi:hypothetical protein
MFTDCESYEAVIRLPGSLRLHEALLGVRNLMRSTLPFVSPQSYAPATPSKD